MALRSDPSVLNQLVGQLDAFHEHIQGGALDPESVDSGIQRMRTLLRRALAAKPGEMSRLFNVIELLKDQLVGFIKDHR
jgi:hypothetical protein